MPSEAEVKAAIKIVEDALNPGVALTPTMECAAWILAKAYLVRIAVDAERARERALPADEAWLRSIGFTEWDYDLGIFHDGHVLQICEDFSCIIYQNAASEDEHSASLPGRYPTRGQLLDLLAAMGIKVKEASDGNQP